MPLVDEVQNELKQIVKTSQFTEEDLYGWAVDAARLIGNAAFEPSGETQLTVNKYVAILPKEVYLIDNIFACTLKQLAYTTRVMGTQEEPACWLRGAVMRPANSDTRRFCTDKCISGNSRDLSYTLLMPPGIVRTSFHTGKIEIHYQKLSMGADGCAQIKDEANTLKATKAYMMIGLLREKFYLQEVPKYVWDDINNEWDEYKQYARLNLKFPSQQDTNYHALKQDARFRQFRYRR
jgi:hypothetical protein